MKRILFSVFLFIILFLISKKIKEPFEKETDKKTYDMLADVIKYIDNSINTRKNAGETSKFSNDKYQKQIMSLENALKYASYIQKNII
jgi:hypothetical protein